VAPAPVPPAPVDPKVAAKAALIARLKALEADITALN
jgi:hypothetical protein